MDKVIIAMRALYCPLHNEPRDACSVSRRFQPRRDMPAAATRRVAWKPRPSGRGVHDRHGE